MFVNFLSDGGIFLLCLINIVLNETIGYSVYGTILVAIQVLIVMFFLIRNDYFRSFVLFLVFLFTALEFPADLKLRPKIYTFRTIEILNVSISTWVLIIFFVYGLIFRNGISKLLNNISKFQIILYVLLICSILIGLSGNIFSDYAFQYFLKDVQYYLIILFSFIIFSDFGGRDIDKAIESIILYTLCSRSIVSFVGISFGALKGNYGGVSIFSYDAIDLFVVFTILAISRTNTFLKNLLIVISWILGIISNVIIQSSGKSLLLIGVVFLEIIVLVMKTRSSFLRSPLVKVFLILAIFIGLLIMYDLINTVSSKNILLSSKLYQVQTLLDLNWVRNPYNLEPSPRDRVLEIYNTYYYFVENPQFFLLGTGMGGYFKEAKYYNYSASDVGGYSTYEIKSRQFYSPHESLANVFLKFGIVGIVLYLWMLVSLLRKQRCGQDLFLKNILFFSILLFIGFSMKLAVVIGYAVYKMDSSRHYSTSSKVSRIF